MGTFFLCEEAWRLDFNVLNRQRQKYRKYTLRVCDIYHNPTKYVFFSCQI
jgi:hypothetical protein